MEAQRVRILPRVEMLSDKTLTYQALPPRLSVAPTASEGWTTLRTIMAGPPRARLPQGRAHRCPTLRALGCRSDSRLSLAAYPFICWSPSKVVAEHRTSI